MALALAGAGCGSLRGAGASADDSPREALLDPGRPHWDQRAPDVFQVRFETSEGDFTVQCRRLWAPIGVDRFYNLARAGFFDDSRFFRVLEGFIAQFGIHSADPAIANVWRAATIPDDPVVSTNTRGALAYAMTGPDTRTTQIYINLVDNTRLDAQGFAPIGRVVQGMDVVDRLYAGYGEDAGGGVRRGRQDRMFDEGNTHLDADSPLLTRIIRASIVQP